MKTTKFSVQIRSVKKRRSGYQLFLENNQSMILNYELFAGKIPPEKGQILTIGVFLGIVAEISLARAQKTPSSAKAQLSVNPFSPHKENVIFRKTAAELLSSLKTLQLSLEAEANLEASRNKKRRHL